MNKNMGWYRGGIKNATIASIFRITGGYDGYSANDASCWLMDKHTICTGGKGMMYL